MTESTATSRLTLAYLNECFHYDPETGVLTWKLRPAHHFRTTQGWKKTNTHFGGKVAGSLGRRYLLVQIAGVTHRVNRLAYAIHHGIEIADMDFYVDHIDLNPLNNRADNLRPATNSQNQGNTQMLPTNTSGVRGVSWSKKNQRWQARIKVMGKLHHLGQFRDLTLAAAAYQQAALAHFGEYARKE